MSLKFNRGMPLLALRDPESEATEYSRRPSSSYPVGTTSRVIAEDPLAADRHSRGDEADATPPPPDP
jgi:hypothetical protein